MGTGVASAYSPDAGPGSGAESLSEQPAALSRGSQEPSARVPREGRASREAHALSSRHRGRARSPSEPISAAEGT